MLKIIIIYLFFCRVKQSSFMLDLPLRGQGCKYMYEKVSVNLKIKSQNVCLRSKNYNWAWTDAETQLVFSQCRRVSMRKRKADEVNCIEEEELTGAG